MSYFSADEKYLDGAAQPQQPPQAREPERPAPVPRPTRGGYFGAEARLLGDANDSRAAPWGLRLSDGSQKGEVLFSWQRPYATVEGFAVEGKQDGGEWRRLAEYGRGQTEARLTLTAGGWQLRVGSSTGTALHFGSEVATWIAPAAPIANEVVRPAPDTVPTVIEPAVLACPQPGCGAILRLAPTGELRCGYCGAAAVLGDSGVVLALDTLLYGPCLCCLPRRPLLRDGESLVCLGHPSGPRYPIPGAPSPNSAPAAEQAAAPEWSWDAIDRALRDNSAALGTHGLFIRN